MLSATWNTLARLWLITTTAKPWSRRVRSSSSLGSPSIDRAMATDWRCPPDSDATWVRTLGMRTASRLRTPLACRSMTVSSSSRLPPVRSRPRWRLATTSRLSLSARSWYTVAIPRALAACGLWTCTGRPSNRYSPASAISMPEMILTRVDFPAPLSPTSAMTRPAWASKSTSSSACTAPNRLLTPWRSSRGTLSGTLPPSRTGARRAAGGTGPPPIRTRSGEACLRAGRRHRAGAELVGLDEAVRDHLADRLLGRVLGHGDRRQDDRGDVLLSIVGLGGGQRV